MTIGMYSFVGAGAVVNTNIDPFVVVGVPARQIGWVDKQGEKRYRRWERPCKMR